MKTITGNTFPVKEKIKALGGRWNADARGWDVPDDRASEALALVSRLAMVHTASRSDREGERRAEQRMEDYAGGFCE